MEFLTLFVIANIGVAHFYKVLSKCGISPPNPSSYLTDPNLPDQANVYL